MNEEEKVKMKLDIAGESFVLSVPYSRQEETRRSEAEINMIYSTWRQRFPEKGDRELLAMIAFRYADRYASLMREREETMEELRLLDRRLDSLKDKGLDVPSN